MIAVPLVTMPSHEIIWVNGFTMVMASSAGEDPDRPDFFTTHLALANGMNVVVRGNVDYVLKCLAGDEEAAKVYYDIYVEPAMINGPKKVQAATKPKLIV